MKKIFDNSWCRNKPNINHKCIKRKCIYCFSIYVKYSKRTTFWNGDNICFDWHVNPQHLVVYTL